MRTNFFWRSAAVVVAAIAMLTIQTRTVSAQEDKFKAIFIYNFTKQIEWPASESNDDFVICVVNQDDVFVTIIVGELFKRCWASLSKAALYVMRYRCSISRFRILSTRFLT